MVSPDPEVAELTSKVRSLTRQARHLSVEINGTLGDLVEFQQDIRLFREDLVAFQQDVRLLRVRLLQGDRPEVNDG